MKTLGQVCFEAHELAIHEKWDTEIKQWDLLEFNTKHFFEQAAEAVRLETMERIRNQ